MPSRRIYRVHIDALIDTFWSQHSTFSLCHIYFQNSCCNYDKTGIYYILGATSHIRHPWMQQPNESAERLFQSPAEFPIAENGDWAGLWKEPKHRGGHPLHPDRPPTAMLAMRPLIYSAPSETSGRSVRSLSTNKSCNRQGIDTMGL